MSVERLLAEARKPYADKIMALEAENMELAEQLAKAKDAIDAMVAAQQAELRDQLGDLSWLYTRVPPSQQ